MGFVLLVINMLVLLPPVLREAAANDLRPLRSIGNLSAVTVTEGIRLLLLLVVTCFRVTDVSLFPRLSPVTLTPFTMLIPKIPDIDYALNMLFMKFGEPKSHRTAMTVTE
jgi:hypothetical protein